MTREIREVPIARFQSDGLPKQSISPAYEISRVVKSGQGVCYGVAGYNSKASAQFILLMDATGVPGTGTGLTIIPITVGASSNFSIDFGIYGIPFQSGLVITNSSTSPTVTVGSADCFYNVRFL